MLKLSGSRKLYTLLRQSPAFIRNTLLTLYCSINRTRLFHRKYPKTFTFFITERCNLHCPFCFIAKEKQSIAEELGPSCINAMALSLKGIIQQLVVTGGEPFLKDVETVCRVFIEKAACKDFAIVTNGWFTGKIRDLCQNLAAFPDVRVSFQLSLDGPQAFHDSIRGSGAYAHLMETLSVLKKLKETTKTIGNVTVVTMLTEEGLPHVSETMAIVSSFGFAHDFNVVRGTRHSTSPEFKEYFNDFNPKNDLYLADYKKMETMVSGLFKNVSSVPENILEKLLRSKYHYQLQFHFSGTTGLLCTAGRTNVVLRANGDISVCEMLKPLGNIQESNCNFRKFWQGTAVKNILKIVERCSCSHDCAIVNAIPYNTTALQRLFGKTD